MTIKDGFKFGIGLILAQLTLAILVTVILLPLLYFTGTAIKDKVQEAAISTLLNNNQTSESK